MRLRNCWNLTYSLWWWQEKESIWPLTASFWLATTNNCQLLCNKRPMIAVCRKKICSLSDWLIVVILYLSVFTIASRNVAFTSSPNKDECTPRLQPLPINNFMVDNCAIADYNISWKLSLHRVLSSILAIPLRLLICWMEKMEWSNQVMTFLLETSARCPPLNWITMKPNSLWRYRNKRIKKWCRRRGSLTWTKN